jgi:hypothetical protein
VTRDPLGPQLANNGEESREKFALVQRYPAVASSLIVGMAAFILLSGVEVGRYLYAEWKLEVAGIVQQHAVILTEQGLIRGKEEAEIQALRDLKEQMEKLNSSVEKRMEILENYVLPGRSGKRSP